MIKKTTGAVYGPVDTETLKKWIEENRVVDEDLITEEGKYEWKKLNEIPELSSSISSQTPSSSKPYSQTLSSTSESDIGKYGIMFGVLNFLIGGWMFTGGVFKSSKVIYYISHTGKVLGGLGKFFKGIAILGIIITTILWLPLLISGLLILARKNAGRKLGILTGQILTYAIPISFLLAFGFRKIFSLAGLITAILFFYIFIMWQNLIKSEFDEWFS